MEGMPKVDRGRLAFQVLFVQRVSSLHFQKQRGSGHAGQRRGTSFLVFGVTNDDQLLIEINFL